VEDANRKNIVRTKVDRGCNVDFIGPPGDRNVLADKNQEHRMKVAYRLAH
jgi:hypothetical protein